MISDRLGVVGVPVAGPGPWPFAARVPRFRAAIHHPGGPMTAAGADLHGDPQVARERCVAEGVERYAATVPRVPHAIGSSVELTRSGFDLLAPERLGAVVGPTTPIGWLSAVDGRLVPLNAALGHLSAYAPRAGEGTYPQGSTGLAAGLDLVTARESASAEVLERDVVARAWREGALLPTTPLRPPLRRLADDAGLDASAHLLPTGHAASRVALVALRHSRRRLLGVGAAYRPDPARALEKAFTEAVVSLGQAAEVLDPRTGPGMCEAPGLASWRADRAYARNGWGHVDDLAGHVQLLLDPRLQRAVWARFTGQPPTALPAGRGRPASELLTGSATVDLTPPDITGHVVCRVLTPGAEVVRPAAFTPEELPCPLV
ncbi:YcaO-like family protein [Nocardioides sp.]|uniref:YcaO-like family protein n=1 Tax=Nocardioides sp. TaxID=35761 RepID=UPI002734633C|nr:YcaO-like family protein [Nocardioides sp.]MDP3890295.1 YcaO-like family protein [Nocardioides sp.]